MSSVSDPPIIYYISPGRGTLANFAGYSGDLAETVSHAIDDGVELIQIREKAFTTKQQFELTKMVVDLARGRRVKVLVNERPDIAVAAGADGVHLTSSSIPVAAVRAIIGNDGYICVSTHDKDEVAEAFEAGADSVVFAPIFETPGKLGSRGIEELRQVCGEHAGRTVIALGGIDSTNCELAIEAGATGIAAIRGLNDPVERRAIIQLLRIRNGR